MSFDDSKKYLDTTITGLETNSQKIGDLNEESYSLLDSMLSTCEHPNKELHKVMDELPLVKNKESKDDSVIRVNNEIVNLQNDYSELSKSYNENVTQTRAFFLRMFEPIKKISDNLNNYNDNILNYLEDSIQYHNELKERLNCIDNKSAGEINDAFKKNKDGFIQFNDMSYQHAGLYNGIIRQLSDNINQIVQIFKNNFSSISNTSKNTQDISRNICEKSKDKTLSGSAKELSIHNDIRKIVNSFKKTVNEIENSAQKIKVNREKLTKTKNEAEEKIAEDEVKLNNLFSSIIEENKKIDNMLQKEEKKGTKKLVVPNYLKYIKNTAKIIGDVNQKVISQVENNLAVTAVKSKAAVSNFDLDLLFIMDITGSMSRFLQMCKDHITSIVQKITANNLGIEVRVGFEGYRDIDDLKNGLKYSHVGFTKETKSLLDKIDLLEAEGGCDDAEDVAGGLNSAINQNWESNAKFAILICDAPGHGKYLHKSFPDVTDDYPNGDPKGLVIEKLIAQFVQKKINLFVLKITERTNDMFNVMKKAYEEENNKSISNVKYMFEIKDLGEDLKDSQKIVEMIIDSANIIFKNCRKNPNN